MVTLLILTSLLSDSACHDNSVFMTILFFSHISDRLTYVKYLCKCSFWLNLKLVLSPKTIQAQWKVFFFVP